MTESPNAATARVDPDTEARPADVTCPSPPAPVGRPAGDESVEAVKHCDLLERPPIWPPRRDDRQHRFRLRSGDWVLVRQLRPEDAPALAAAVERLSALSRYRRFHSALPRLTEQMISYLTDIDHHDHEALVAVPPGTGGIIVGVARFIRDPAHPDTAEVAVAVADSWQRRGLGTLLLRRLARRASEVGISSVTGDILAENRPTIELARRLGARSMDNHGSTVTTRMDIADCAVDDSDAGSLLRALAAAESSWAAADPADAGLVCRTHPDARRASPAPGEFVEPPLPGLSFDVVAPLPGSQDSGAPEGAGGGVTAVGGRAAPPGGAVVGEAGGGELLEVLPGCSVSNKVRITMRRLSLCRRRVSADRARGLLIIGRLEHIRGAMRVTALRMERQDLRACEPRNTGSW